MGIIRKQKKFLVGSLVCPGGKVLKQVCFVDDKGDILSFPKRVKPSPSIYKEIREQRHDLKDVTFLNELSFDDAVSKIKSVEVSDG